MRQTEWVSKPENFIVGRGLFDYDISCLDIDEKAPIARPNLICNNERNLQQPAVYDSVNKFAVCNPDSLKNRMQTFLKGLGQLRNRSFGENEDLRLL